MPFKDEDYFFFHWNTKLIRKTFSIKNHPSWPPAEKFCYYIIAFKYTEAIICVFHSIDKKKYKRGKNAKKGKHNSFEDFEHMFNSFYVEKREKGILFVLSGRILVCYNKTWGVHKAWYGNRSFWKYMYIQRRNVYVVRYMCTCL